MFNKFHLSTNVISGPGCISELAKEAKKITSDSIMIITDKGLRQAGIIDKIEAPLKEDGYTVLIFDEVEPNPSINTANKASKLIIENNIKLVIAVGGGSSIDTSKSACMLATNGGDLRDYAGFDMFNETPIPFFCNTYNRRNRKRSYYSRSNE